MDRPSLRYDHAFAVVRYDAFQKHLPIEDKISIVKVGWERGWAEREAQRLSRLNASKGCYYFVALARIERPGSTEGADLVRPVRAERP